MFQIEVLKSKIHRVRVTEANLNYVGSITIDEALMEAANLIEGEKVQILDIDNGERFETYVIKGPRLSGAICLNGAAARKVQVGDVVIIVSYARWISRRPKPSNRGSSSPTRTPTGWSVDPAFLPEPSGARTLRVRAPFSSQSSHTGISFVKELANPNNRIARRSVPAHAPLHPCKARPEAKQDEIACKR